MKTFLYGPDTRVRVRRGRFPLDRSLVGRNGMIVSLHDYGPQRYGVTLDGESEVRDFAEEELEPLREGAAPVGDAAGAAGSGVGPRPSGGSAGQG